MSFLLPARYSGLDPESRNLCNQQQSLSLAFLDSRAGRHLNNPLCLRERVRVRASSVSGHTLDSRFRGSRGRLRKGLRRREWLVAAEGHRLRIIMKMIDVGFTQSASSSLNIYPDPRISNCSELRGTSPSTPLRCAQDERFRVNAATKSEQLPGSRRVDFPLTGC